jgi:hypothetical protein
VQKEHIISCHYSYVELYELHNKLGVLGKSLISPQGETGEEGKQFWIFYHVEMKIENCVVSK